MARRVQYNFPYPEKGKETTDKALEKAIEDSILLALSKVVPGKEIRELTIEILGVATPVADITKEVIKIALNPEDYGVGELTAAAFKIVAGLVVPKALKQVLASSKLKNYLAAGAEILGVGAYSYLLESADLDIAFDAFFGTFDAELRLIDQDGKLLGSGFYIDGLDADEEVFRAIRDLLEYVNSQSDVPRIEAGSQIAFSRPKIESSTELITLYDAEVVSQLAETTGKTIDEILTLKNGSVTISNRNKEYYQPYGEKKFLVLSDRTEFDIANPSADRKLSSFTAKQIFYNDDKGVLRALDKTEVSSTNANSSGDNLYIGNNNDDVISAYSGNDILLGGQGDDLLFSGEGNDTLIGSTGVVVPDGYEVDVMLGGLGADTFVLGSDDLGFYEKGNDINTNSIDVYYPGFDNPISYDGVQFSNIAPKDFALIDFFPEEGDKIRLVDRPKIEGKNEDYFIGAVKNEGIISVLQNRNDLNISSLISEAYSATIIDGFGEIIAVIPYNFVYPVDAVYQFQNEIGTSIEII